MPEITTMEMNQRVMDQLASNNPDMRKEGTDNITNYTRMRVREDGILRRTMPPTPITSDQLDRAVDHDGLCKIVDKEADSPAAVSLPFATLPANQYIVGDRYRVDMARIVTPRFTSDVDQLRSHDYDIREVISNNSLKDALAEEDGKFFGLVNTLLVGQGIPIAAAGNIALWQAITGGITRETLNDATKIMNRTPGRLSVSTIVANQIFAKDLQKWGFDETGGDLSQEITQKGIVERELFGVRWLFTIKRDLVPDNTIFMFTQPDHLGKFFILEDMVMHLKKEAYMLWWFAYELIGAAIGNTNGISRVDFGPSAAARTY